MVFSPAACQCRKTRRGRGDGRRLNFRLGYLSSVLPEKRNSAHLDIRWSSLCFAEFFLKKSS
jgi:hypothetical protein